MAYENYRDKRKVVKWVMRRAERDTDAKWGSRLSQKFEKNKKKCSGKR